MHFEGGVILGLHTGLKQKFPESGYKYRHLMENRCCFPQFLLLIANIAIIKSSTILLYERIII